MKYINRSFAFAALGFLAVAYQNCSPMKFGTSSAAIGVEEVGSSVKDADPSETEPGEAKPKVDISNESAANCREALEKIALATPVPDGGSVVGARGVLELSGNQIASIEETHGQIRISSLDPKAKIASLNHSRGNIFVCNMDVGKIENTTQGRIIVVGGDVGDVSNFAGQLEVIGGKILGQVTDTTGVIKVK